VREGSLKIVRSAANKPWELYDLANDPGETKYLATERPDDVQRLSAAYESFLADVKQDASKEAPVIK
jgi:arylsulfatase A-like enzyme